MGKLIISNTSKYNNPGVESLLIAGIIFEPGFRILPTIDEI